MSEKDYNVITNRSNLRNHAEDHSNPTMFLEKGGRPPSGMITPAGPQLFFTIFTHIPLIPFVTIAIRNVIAKGDPTLLAFLIGGAMCTLFEPIVDVLGFCYFPSENQWVGLRVFERDIPIFMWAVYSWFVGGQAYIFYEKFRTKQCTKSKLWTLYAQLVLVNAALELPGLLLGVYTYYGRQPLEVFGFPLWWPALNPIMPIAAGFTASLLTPHAPGLESLTIIFLPIMADGAVNGALGWPVWTALGSNSGYATANAAAGITFLLALFFIWAITTSLPNELDYKVDIDKIS